MEFMIFEIPIELLRALSGGGGPPRHLEPAEREKFRLYAKAVMNLATKGVAGEALAMAQNSHPFIYQTLLHAILDDAFEHYERDISVEDCAADINRVMQQQKDEAEQEVLRSMPNDGIKH